MAWLGSLLAIPLLGAAVYLVVSTSWGLLRNYLAARTIGVPIRFIPISPLNPFWVLVDRKVLSVLRRLPLVGKTSFARYNWRGWELHDRYKSHHEMGDFWVLVTPFKNWIYINDPDTLMSIFKRPVDFPRPVFVNEILDVFGPNISSAEGESWKTQRRIATRCFNEQNNEIVWTETTALARDMLEYWTATPSLRTAADDLRTLSLNVLSRAAFGQSVKFEGHSLKKSSSSTSSSTGTGTGTDNYGKALQYILENCIFILAFGTKFISYPWLPRKFRDVHAAWTTFRSYMTDVYEREKLALSEGKTADPNLLTMLIRASQEDQPESKSESGLGSAALTESEIYGNMFAFSFAGHDTTANTFTFAVYFLAAHPEVQDWLLEELEAVFGPSSSSTSTPSSSLRESETETDYRAAFPRLKRCLAVMYETMRLYTPVPVMKWTGEKPQPISVGGKKYVLPPHSMISPSWGSIQSDPRIWGPDSLTWRPQRWIRDRNSTGIPISNENGKSSSRNDDQPQPQSTPGNEEFSYPPRGAFVGWSEGIRDCPGRKFSQVEFVAAMATLFRHARVEPVVLSEDVSSSSSGSSSGMSAEAREMARKRVMRLIEKDSGCVLLLQLLHPERAPLRWTRRGGGIRI